MTSPTPAAALAAALERVPFAWAGWTDKRGDERAQRARSNLAGDILAALAASGWQVTRQGEGLRAALESIVQAWDSTADTLIEDAIEAARPLLGSHGRPHYYDCTVPGCTLDGHKPRAALASGEEGQ